MSYDRAGAQAYGGKDEPALPGVESMLLLALLAAPPLAGKAQDLGAGTGLLTALLKRAGLTVTGLERSQAMIDQGLRKT